MSTSPITLEQLGVEPFMKTVRRHWEEAQRSVSQPRLNHELAAMVEAFWWVRVGAQIGFLDFETANYEFRQNAAALLNHYSEFKVQWSSLLDYDVVSELDQAFDRKSLVEVADVRTESAIVKLHSRFQTAA